MADYILSYTGEEIEARLSTLDDHPISKKLLWENASPASDFAGQDISISNLSNYDEVEIEYICYSGSSFRKRVKGKIGENVVGDMVMSNAGYIGSSAVYVGFRGMYVTSNGVTFHDACSYAATANNIVKPVRIYGIKGVQ